jgi:putative methyltransferase (TIGR04325 family)
MDMIGREYESWSKAAAASGTYNSPVIVDKVRDAVLCLIKGTHHYERDGTPFYEGPENYAIRSVIKDVCSPGTTIIDIGGGLGGTFLNNADILTVKGLNYLIVELPLYCKEGSRLAQKYQLPLRFYPSIEQIEVSEPPKLVILSGVLQYIQHWTETVRRALKLDPEQVVVDRIPVSYECIRFYSCAYADYYGVPVSFPLQTILEKHLLAEFHNFALINEWPSEFDPPDGNPRGFHFVRN